MEEAVSDSEKLMLPPKLNEVEEEVEEEEEEEESGGGVISNLISNLVPRSRGVSVAVVEATAEGGHDKNEEKEGGFMNHLISNMVSPFSPKPKPAAGEVEVENGSSTSGEGEGGAIINNNIFSHSEEEVGGNGIIDNLVSHLSSAEDAAPTTDEASILIHSIVHD